MDTKTLQAAEWAAELEVLSKEFQDNESILKAISDEMRQRLLLIMIKHADGRGTGMRVGNIAAELNLSRPAVSHHLKILKDCGLVSIRRDGTKNYYHFRQSGPVLDGLIEVLQHARDLIADASQQTELD